VHHGRVVKRTRGGSIIEFRSVVDAVRCAIEVQAAMVERNVGVPPERRIKFRVGIHLEEGLVRVYSAKARICPGICLLLV
jgi:adenylate cyclase